MSKSMLIIDTPKSCADCRLRNGLFCGTNGNSLYDYIHYDDSLNDKPSWCPLKEYKKAIPIEWIKDYIIPFQVHHDSLSEDLKENDGAGWVVDVLETMLREWEKENEAN